MGLCNRVDQEIAPEGEPPKVSLETIGLEVSLGQTGDTRGHSEPALRYPFSSLIVAHDWARQHAAGDHLKPHPREG